MQGIDNHPQKSTSSIRSTLTNYLHLLIHYPLILYSPLLSHIHEGLEAQTSLHIHTSLLTTSRRKTFYLSQFLRQPILKTTMLSQKPLAVTLIAISTAQAICNNSMYEIDSGACTWVGSAPFCPQDMADYCDTMDTPTGAVNLWATTRVYDINDLLELGYITQECYDDYGGNCLDDGWKTLWCEGAWPQCSG